ncbi:cytochrome-c oxidase, cbb3-type subunit III [Paracoccus sp. (in: a-proteobacteria)]|uniref:cytochrome-c oxidase, cbb3-type subunit III n=1 Tax=Paracoccus sp. TaxID=267 RepID=UPI0026DFDE14|nr:cytochrome-c oxidase, cbb3-type subunit III [Paracoccus sp. (in: a-proteobacteria)]MDO5647560.1 cytochrome-c oxidase, cbb3-type subunit III [Paracoccus sp. (in: a-proteobacteria)]
MSDDNKNKPTGDLSDEHVSPANPDNQIELGRQAADAEHAAKIEGDIPDRAAPDAPEAPKHRAKSRGRHGVVAHETPSTGHEWDGITEYDNPMPRWWLWTFYATIIWAIGYMIAYPAIPLLSGATQGLLKTNARTEVAAEIQRFNDANAPMNAALVETPLDQIAADPQLASYAGNAGGALYRTWCAQCHGSGAAGAPGYPNLLDDVWLWGGTLDDIHTTLLHGIRDPQDPDTRYSQMPGYGVDGLLNRTEIADVTQYVLSLSGAAHNATQAAAGAVTYENNCAACHQPDGSGDQFQGAPALNDQVWLYGGDAATITRIIHEGPYGVMPAWSNRLTEAEIRALTVYVHGLGGGE